MAETTVNKILIYVEGGIVQDVYGTEDYEVFDLDVKRDELGSSRAAREAWDKAYAEFEARPKQFSVLLSIPDYIAGGDLETFFTIVEVPNVTEAVKLAREEAVVAHGLTLDSLEDYKVLLVFSGAHRDLNPEM